MKQKFDKKILIGGGVLILILLLFVFFKKPIQNPQLPARWNLKMYPGTCVATEGKVDKGNIPFSQCSTACDNINCQAFEHTPKTSSDPVMVDKVSQCILYTTKPTSVDASNKDRMCEIYGGL